MFVIFTISINSNEKIGEAYQMFSASLFLLIPAMIMIAMYSDFPRWVNIAGIVSMIPMVAENIAFTQTGKFTMSMMIIDFIGNSLLALTTLFWGIYVWRNAKKETA
jgi:hypothetical protein